MYIFSGRTNHVIIVELPVIERNWELTHPMSRWDQKAHIEIKEHISCDRVDIAGLTLGAPHRGLVSFCDRRLT